MSVRSVLKGCHDVLTESANTLRSVRCEHSAFECDLQAEAVARLLEELKKEEETSNGTN